MQLQRINSLDWSINALNPPDADIHEYQDLADKDREQGNASKGPSFTLTPLHGPELDLARKHLMDGFGVPILTQVLERPNALKLLKLNLR